MQVSNIHSKCYDQILVTSDGGAVLQGQFLIAMQSPLTKLWTISSVDIAQNRDETTYEFCGTVAKDLETLEAVQHLSIFEKNKKTQGATERMGFTYPNTIYFRKFAEKETIIFETDTGLPCYLSQGIIPETPGQYKPDDVINAAAAFNDKVAAANKQAQENPSLLDRLLKNYAPEAVDLSPIFTNIQIETLFGAFTDAISKADEALDNASRLDSFTFTFENYHSRKEVYRYDKDFKTNIQKATQILPALAQYTDASSHSYLKEIITIYNMYFDILSLQIAFKKQQEGEEKPNAAKFESEIENIKNKYQVSAEVKSQIGRAAIATRIIKPQVIGDIAHQLKTQFAAYRDAKERMRQQTAHENAVPHTINIRGIGSS